jgi:hypothetical protein
VVSNLQDDCYPCTAPVIKREKNPEVRVCSALYSYLDRFDPVARADLFKNSVPTSMIVKGIQLDRASKMSPYQLEQAPPRRHGISRRRSSRPAREWRAGAGGFEPPYGKSNPGFLPADLLAKRGLRAPCRWPRSIIPDAEEPYGGFGSHKEV